MPEERTRFIEAVKAKMKDLDERFGGADIKWEVLRAWVEVKEEAMSAQRRYSARRKEKEESRDRLDK